MRILARRIFFAYGIAGGNTGPMLKALARLILKAGGWRLAGDLPQLGKAVFVVAPHTSNWDGFWLMAYKVALGIDMHFLAKHTLFWWPLGAVLRAMGAIPVDRAVSAATVQQVAEEFDAHERFWFALSPEGTRQWQPYWKTGFYRIAKTANVPIVLGFIDYGKRRMGIGITLPVGRTPEEDLRAIREFYAGICGRVPERQGPVEFPPDAFPSRTRG